MSDGMEPGEGSGRDRKRRETLHRIAETGLRLFVEKGYGATTLDAIAEAAGISRRTFFAYFRSKEDVLLAWQGSGFTESLRPTMLGTPRDRHPLAAARDCFVRLASMYETRESIEVDKLLRSTETLRMRKYAAFIEMEAILYRSMREVWPDDADRERLRAAAVVATSAMRIALDRWRDDEGKAPLAHHVEATFETVSSSLR